MSITITAGHSNTDSGAVANGYVERDFVVNIRNYVAYYLNQAGLEVKTDGVQKDNQPLRTAIQLAKGAKLAVEFHLNAASNPHVNGIEVLAKPSLKLISQRIAKAISSVTGSNLRGESGWKTEQSGQHSRLGFVRAGGLIVELEFITNAEAMHKLDGTQWLVAQAIADTIIDYVKETTNIKQ